MNAKFIISEVAHKRGFNVDNLVSKTGICPSSIENYWYNRVRGISLKNLTSIARALEVTIDDLIDDPLRRQK